MKKLLLLSLAAGFSLTGFAQNARNLVNPQGVSKAINTTLPYSSNLAKTTALDTTFLSNFPDTTSIITYVADAATPFDSGYLYGTNRFGDKAWAERYDVSGTGAVTVLGMFARFNGNYTANSTKTVSMKVWSAGPRQPFGNLANAYLSGFPQNELASQSVSIKDLGIGLNGAGDTGVTIAFTTPSTLINDSFFVGYAMAYDTLNFGGDTVGVYTTRDGLRFTDGLFIVGIDTVINVQNATQFANNTWSDNNFGNFQQFFHFVMFPIVSFDNAVSTGSVTKNNLQFFGNFPNPASNSTNIKISLKKAADVTVTIMDMNGRIISQIQKNGLTAGEQIIPVSLANMASGSYIYSVGTSHGDNVGSQFIVK